MSDLLVLKDLCKWYGAYQALDHVNLEIPRGSIFGLLGPNGAGKTTLIRIINQITHPDSGEVLFDGKPLNRDHIRRIGYLPEERGLYKSMKVGEQALYLSQLKGLSHQEAKRRLEYWFEKFGVSGWWDKKVQELSKGMAQKVQFIVTVLHEPELLIFDEPFSGFDPINANLIKDEILQLRDKGATVIFSTHRMESVEELCDHIALIHQSRKILDGNLNAIKKAHKSNTYEVGLLHDNPQDLKQELDTMFTTREAVFRSLGEELKLRIALENGTGRKELLSLLNSRAEVTYFNEVIPSANDIFIQTVNEQAGGNGQA
ncbi:ABC transporter ATP-binding protein [Robertkochia flava]|uniref:ABC transporter ATP-binding protein n=1 Tax=Robertkochia flava TaxID=3447986 RepID=UPI001CCC3EDC|nr:ABC transporter ATP-binding protein [Robertkochia marina]